MRAYLDKPEATAEAIFDGSLYTGDLATIYDDGVITIVDRKKDIIIRRGANISCLEVDSAQHRPAPISQASQATSKIARRA